MSLVKALIMLLATMAMAVPAHPENMRLRGKKQPGSSIFQRSAVVNDPGFELGTPNAAWNESSTNFGTPLCSLLDCGDGGGTGPRSGAFWAWFGGIDVFEEGAVSQTIALPSVGSASLTFWLELPVCSGLASDFMEVNLDGTQVFVVNGTDPACGSIGYVQQTVDISAYAGQIVDLEFHSIISGASDMNFFVDDVDIDLVIPVELQHFEVE